MTMNIMGAGFTPHASMEVSLQSTSMPAPIFCSDLEFMSSMQLRCKLPALPAGTWHSITVRNGACGLHFTKPNAYYAS